MIREWRERERSERGKDQQGRRERYKRERPTEGGEGEIDLGERKGVEEGDEEVSKEKRKR